MISQLEENLGSTAMIDHKPAIAADMQDTSADISKASELLNWQPLTSSAEGLAQTAAWHLDNGNWLDSVEI